MIPGPATFPAATSSPGAEAGAGVGAKPTAICPRCDREQTINTAATALTELHYCLVCSQSFVVRRSPAERAAEPLAIGHQDLACQARHPAVPAPPQGDSWPAHTDSCHWFWRYPAVVVGGLSVASLLLYVCCPG